MFARLGRWCHNRRKLVLVLWIFLLFLAQGVSSAVGDDYRQDFDLPGAESTRGLDLLEKHFGGAGAGQAGTIVFEAEQGVNDPAVKTAMEEMFAEVAKVEDVQRVESPYTPGNERFISQSGTIAYANVELPLDFSFDSIAAIIDGIEDAEPENIDGLNIELGGMIFAAFEPPTSEVLGIAFAIVILIVAFGSVLAMGLPLSVALFGIGIGGALVVLISNLMTVPDFAFFIGIMIGLGVGIDYALLIVTRYREQLHSGHSVVESIEIAHDTAGRSVLFAGATVVVSLLGMILMRVGFVGGLAISASATVLVTVLASLTLLPALLGFAGPKIEKTRWSGLVAAGFVALALVGVGLEFMPLLVGFPIAVVALLGGFFVPFLKKEVTHRPPKPLRETLAYRLSRAIQHRAWTFAILSGAALLVLAVPVLSLRLGFSDESNYPDESDTKQAYELLVKGFGAGYNGQLLLVTELADPADFATLGPITEALRADDEVVFVTDPIPNGLAPTAALWTVVPKDGPQSEATESLVHRLRDDVLPEAQSTTRTDVAVTGFTAGNIDFSSLMGQRMPLFFVAVLGMSFLLLMAVFRSLLVPLKAVIMNMLSIGAAYGVIVALFQWGWLGDLTGLTPGPIEPWAPMMLFAIVFGLSMDYEVFLLSRVREEYNRTGDSHTSVADGLASTAKVITAAAAIMVVVFGCFLFENDRNFKLMGTGLSVAILLDATIVRMLLVPATMELLGDRNWWIPKWLDKLLPNIDVEGHAREEIDAAHDAAPVAAPSSVVDLTDEATAEPVVAAPVKTATARKAPAKKVVPAKKATVAKKAAAKKAVAKAPAVKKQPAKKAPAAKKAVAKKTTR